jgi:microcystin-dependent protein
MHYILSKHKLLITVLLNTTVYTITEWLNMTSITETATYDPEVYQIDTDDVVIGGDDGAANASAKNLANRTAWFKQQIENVILKANLEPNNADLELLAKSIEAIVAASTPELDISNSIDSQSESDLASSKAVNDLYLALIAGNRKNELGEPFWHLGETAPAGAMQFEGQILNRAEYSELFASLQNAERNIKWVTEDEKIAGGLYGCWGLGDGAMTFTVPENRGDFIRVWDNGRGVNQNQQLGQLWGHSIAQHDHKTTSDSRPVLSRQGSDAIIDAHSERASYYDANYNGSQRTGMTGSTETRPRGITWMQCFYYE